MNQTFIEKDLIIDKDQQIEIKNPREILINNISSLEIKYKKKTLYLPRSFISPSSSLLSDQDYLSGIDEKENKITYISLQNFFDLKDLIEIKEIELNLNENEIINNILEEKYNLYKKT